MLAQCARAAVALVRFGYGGEVWHLLEYHEDPRARTPHSSTRSARSGLIRNCSQMSSPSKGDSTAPASIATSSTTEKNGYLFDPITSKRRGLILALAGCPKASLGTEERHSLVEQLQHLFETDRDAGVHSAAELALKRWEHPGRVTDEVTRRRG